jgi:hypothetical protein
MLQNLITFCACCGNKYRKGRVTFSGESIMKKVRVAIASVVTMALIAILALIPSISEVQAATKKGKLYKGQGCCCCQTDPVYCLCSDPAIVH